jgi:hypothetical protein
MMAKRPISRRGAKQSTIPKRVMDEAQHHYSHGDYMSAARLVETMLAKQPDNAFLLYFYGACLLQTEHYEDAVTTLEKSLRMPGAKIEARKPLAASLRMLGHAERGHAVLDEGLRDHPDNEALIAAKADMLLAEGRDDEADALIRPVVEKGTFKDHNIALAWGTLCKQAARPEEAIPLLERYWKDESLPPATRVTEMFQLATMYDRVGRFEDAWRVVNEANALRKGSHSRVEHKQSIDRMIGSFTPATWERLTRPTLDDATARLPILIVGMPRSGTTLTEQILGAHSLIEPGGELSTLPNVLWKAQRGAGIGLPDIPQHPVIFSPSVIDRMANEYTEKLREIGPSAARVTDKMPMNLTRLPMVRLLFPDALIVRCKRNILDTAISCWFQNFGTGAGFVYDLEDLAAYIADCHRAEKHSTETLGIEIHPLEYERMVEDQESCSRELIKQTGLEWEDACLRYHENIRDVRTASQDQVRKPIYKGSVARWKKYGDLINPLVEALERNGVDPYASG